VDPLNQYLDGNAFCRCYRGEHLGAGGNAAGFLIRQFLGLDKKLLC
jgi:hypothetical protein